jgi:restriction endonuclease Mrr
VVGQAKHYLSTRSGTPEIRDLAGAISLGRAGAYGGVESAFHDMHIRVADPVFALFVTTGSISSNGWRLLERSGIIGVDGEMVAAFLADRGIGPDNADLDKAVFCEWLSS